MINPPCEKWKKSELQWAIFPPREGEGEKGLLVNIDKTKRMVFNITQAWVTRSEPELVHQGCKAYLLWRQLMCIVMEYVMACQIWIRSHPQLKIHQHCQSHCIKQTQMPFATPWARMSSKQFAEHGDFHCWLLKWKMVQITWHKHKCTIPVPISVGLSPIKI